MVCSNDGGEPSTVDRWGGKETSQDLPQEWTGSPRFRKSWGREREVLSDQTKPPAEGDLTRNVKGDILDLRPTSQQGKRWNVGDPRDHRDTLWLISEKRPKLVIGSGVYILVCTVLYLEQTRRGAWFLHDLCGYLECRHDVFHAHARDRRDGGRVRFLTCSPHLARRVEGSKRRENLGSEICEGRPQQVGDVGHTSAVILLVSETQASSVDLTPHTLKRRSRRSESGQIVQVVNSIRQARYWDGVKGGWLDPGLVRKAREEDMLYVKKDAVHEKVPMSQCWKKTEKNSIKTGTRTRERPSVRHLWRE